MTFDPTALRPLGRGGLRVPAHSFGAAGLGNLYQALDEDAALDTVHAAWESGIRYFDTAPHYGLGLSEERLGVALGGHARDEYVVSSKVGRLLVETDAFPGQRDTDFDVPLDRVRVWDFTRDGVLRSIDDTLTRMGLDRIDIAFVHDPHEHIAEALDGAFPALEELRTQGVIASYGAGMNSPRLLSDLIRSTDLDTVMVAGRTTLLDQSGYDELLPLALERNVSVVAAGVFNSGLLATDRPAAGARYEYSEADPAVLEQTTRIAEVCESHGVTLPAAAVQFPLQHPAVSTVCLGAQSRTQVERNAPLFEVEIPEALWSDLEESGLVR